MVEKAQADSKQHVDDPKNNRHFHLEGVEEGQFIGCNVPNLLNARKPDGTTQGILKWENNIHLPKKYSSYYGKF